MKKFFLLAMGVICLQACKNNTTDTAKEAKTPSEMVENTATKSQKEEGGATEISDISIYNLPDTWTTQNGNQVQWKDFQGNVLVVVMIYTSCKAACPILIADMREIRKTVD